VSHGDRWDSASELIRSSHTRYPSVAGCAAWSPCGGEDETEHEVPQRASRSRTRMPKRAQQYRRRRIRFRIRTGARFSSVTYTTSLRWLSSPSGRCSWDFWAHPVSHTRAEPGHVPERGSDSGGFRVPAEYGRVRQLAITNCDIKLTNQPSHHCPRWLTVRQADRESLRRGSYCESMPEIWRQIGVACLPSPCIMTRSWCAMEDCVPRRRLQSGRGSSMLHSWRGRPGLAWRRRLAGARSGTWPSHHGRQGQDGLATQGRDALATIPCGTGLEPVTTWPGWPCHAVRSQ